MSRSIFASLKRNGRKDGAFLGRFVIWNVHQQKWNITAEGTENEMKSARNCLFMTRVPQQTARRQSRASEGLRRRAGGV